jgi:hypothetical protein
MMRAPVATTSSRILARTSLPFGVSQGPNRPAELDRVDSWEQCVSRAPPDAPHRSPGPDASRTGCAGLAGARNGSATAPALRGG